MAGPPWEDPRRVLKRHALFAKRGFSQNFLVAPHAVERIAEAVLSDADSGRESPVTVVELGPGLGTLTAALLRASARVVAVELDRDMIGVLEAELGDCDLRIVPGDAAKIDYAQLRQQQDAPLRVAGNLPYAATGAILRRLVEARAHVARAVLMVQREVAERLLSEPGRSEYGALTVFTRAAYEVERIMNVPAGAFHPRPRVDSCVVRLRSRPDGPAIEGLFELVVRAAFQRRRKTLRNAMSAQLQSDEVDAALRGANIDGQRRGETLSVVEFSALAAALRQAREAGEAPGP